MSTISAVQIHPTNAAQLRAWDGDEGAYWANHADYFDRSVAPYHQQLFASARIADAERILDIGCGTGQTTLDAARAATRGSALGIDLSARMLDVARGRAAAEELNNAAFLQADAQVHPFPPESFDVVISRTGAMFFGDLTAALANIRRALVPAGRLVLVVWQPLSANEWMREISGALAAGRDLPAPPDGPGPFALSDPERVRPLLAAGGFADIEFVGTSAGMWFGTDADDAHRFVLGFTGWMLDGLDEAARARAEQGLHTTLAAHETPDGVLFGSATWTIHATRCLDP